MSEVIRHRQSSASVRLNPGSPVIFPLSSSSMWCRILETSRVCP